MSSLLRNSLLVLIIATLVGCGQAHDPNTAASEKIEGPDVKSLAHEQLMDVLHECRRYGSSDDPKVKYTVRYCSAAQRTHAMEGYSASGAAPIKPSIDKLQ